MACFLFESGIILFLSAKKRLICLYAVSSNSSGRLKAMATASAVRSSLVGPKPPVQIQQSARCDIFCSNSTRSLILSPTAVCRVTVKPQITACCANQAALVSTVCPVTISSPWEKISSVGFILKTH